jgi:division protein CdvB (Snf7/Vps24/ESCRT-III family)
MAKIKEEAGAAGQEFSKLVRQRTNLENLGTSVKGQAKDWKNAGTAIKDYIKKTGNIKGAKKDVDDMKKHMSAYLKKIQELAKANGLSVSRKQVQELRAAIDGMNAENIEEVADSFAAFSENLGKGTDGKIAKLDGQIEQLRDKMVDM